MATKMSQIYFRPVIRPRPCWEAHDAPPISLFRWDGIGISVTSLPLLTTIWYHCS